MVPRIEIRPNGVNLYARFFIMEMQMQNSPGTSKNTCESGTVSTRHSVHHAHRNEEKDGRFKRIK